MSRKRRFEFGYFQKPMTAEEKRSKKRLSPQAYWELHEQYRHLASIKQEIRQTA